jgi:sterol desaturase/sphingolipid hydroxylase (fatty acid hydroxylase superfamily)
MIAPEEPAMEPNLGSVVVGLMVLALVFWPLERLRPSRKQPTWRTDTPTGHHTTQAEGLDKNFAGLFPFIDLAFGTFYMPRDRPPAAFGIQGNPVPRGLFAQLASPFRRT